MPQHIDDALPVMGMGLLAALAMSAGLISTDAQTKFTASDHPTAVLAWSTTACDAASGTLLPGAPRAHPEVLYSVAAAFDNRVRHGARTEACADAWALSSRVADTAPQHHAAAGRASLAAHQP